MAELVGSSHGEGEPLGYETRSGTEGDQEFIIEMARRIHVSEGRKLPEADVDEALEILPGSDDIVVVAMGIDGVHLGAAWTFFYPTPLLCHKTGDPLPEMVVAVSGNMMDEALEAALIAKIVELARGRFTALSMHVNTKAKNIRAVWFYIEQDFKVRAPGRRVGSIAMCKEIPPAPANPIW